MFGWHCSITHLSVLTAHPGPEHHLPSNEKWKSKRPNPGFSLLTHLLPDRLVLMFFPVAILVKKIIRVRDTLVSVSESNLIAWNNLNIVSLFFQRSCPTI